MKQKSFAVSLLIVMFISISSNIVIAQNNNETEFDPTLSYEWLIENCIDGDCGSITATAFYAMAMKLSTHGPTYGMQAVKYIQSEMNMDEACFPKNNCNIKDTAMAYWVLSNYGEDTSGIEDYIKSKLGVGLVGNWWLEIITTASNKVCTIAYPKEDGSLEQEDILVDEGTFPTCNAGQPETFFDLNKCLQTQNLVNTNPLVEIIVDCSNIGEGTTLSIIYNYLSSYHIIGQATQAKYKKQLTNACHNSGSICDKDTSLWANWVLVGKNSNIEVNHYLIDKYDNLDVVDLSLMYLSTTDTAKEASYLEDLSDIQRLDGSFNQNNRETAIAILALKKGGLTEEIGNALSYLEESRRNEEGSWDGDKETTALVLYSAFTGAGIILPPMGPSQTSAGIEDYCGDNICNPLTENENTCPDDCVSEPSTTCNNDGICDVDYGESKFNCASDCFCGDGICENSEELTCDIDCATGEESSEFCGDNLREGSEECDGYDDSQCPADYTCSGCICEPSTKPKKGIGNILIIVAIVILLLIAAFIALKHYFPKKKGPTKSFGSAKFRPSTGGFNQQITQQRRELPQKIGLREKKGGKSKTELELEKSIKEARKLLGGK